jgi:hypothetical protein
MVEQLEVKATGGVGAFFYALIPWALGIGGTALLTAYITAHTIHRQIEQEARMAHYVGADHTPKAPYAIEAIYPIDSVTITRADFDGSALLMYSKNVGHDAIGYLAWHWQTVSPDGTVLASGFENNATCASPMQPGQSAECKVAIDGDDDRVAKIQIWVNR